MESNGIIAAAMPAWPVLAGAAVVVLILVIALAVLLTRRRGAAAPAGQEATPAQANPETRPAMQARLRNLAADLDMVLETKPEEASGAPTSTHTAVSRPVEPAPIAPAPVATRVDQTPTPLRVVDDATRLFGTDEVQTTGSATAQPVREDATRYFGAADEGALLSPAQTRYFSPSELDDESDLDMPFGSTGMLQALPPKRDDVPEAVEAPAAEQTESLAPVLDNVQAFLRTVTAPEVLSLSVIDSTGQVLAGATDEEVAGELRAMLAESGRGAQADVVQPLRFDDDSRGAVFLLPTGADALLGALVREDDLQQTRSYLRDVAIQIGETLRAAS